ncbi:DNA polymerase III subunit gamma/tau [Candidatus Saccharibacteria bacterium]|nr:DNA polymerase III subunit gamma/tau [Candidatus Saccharibacteria bacterium]
MGKALYRKYRPTKLTNVIGQDQITNTLESIIKKGNISHSYLFCGPRGTGKTTIARIFAHAINNFDYQLEDDYVDIVEIDAASNRGIDNIRELRENAIVAPTKGKYKVYILDESHMLTKEASNALLKILEEPPKHIVFIMATTDPQKVLPTILSRSQVYTFRLASPEVMKNHLATIAKKEKINITDDALDILVKRGGGSFRDSISLLDQISNLSDSQITAESINKTLGLPQDKLIDDLLLAYTTTDVDKITTLLKEILNTGSKAETIAEETINKIIASPKRELLPLLEKLPDVKAPFPEAKLLLAFLQQGKRASTPTVPLLATPTPTPKSTPTSSPATTTTHIPDATSFSWETFLAQLAKKSTLLSNILKKSKYKQDTSTLHLYVKNQGIFNSTNNKALLSQLSGCTVIIHDLSEYNSKNFGQISDIMGNVEEVNDNGNPFQ